MGRLTGPAVVVLALAIAGCDDRDRPLPTEPGPSAELTVDILAPGHNELAIAGREVSVRVRGQDPGGQLLGLGFVAFDAGPGHAVIGSEEVRFGSTTDTVAAFTFTVPASARENLQIDFVGVAFGPGDQEVHSRANGVVVVHCTPEAVWC